MSATEASENVLGKTIKTLLKVRGLKAYELGEAIGMSPTSISKIMNGVSRPRQNSFTRMCQALCKTKEEERRLVAAFAGTELLDEEPDEASASSDKEILRLRAEQFIERKTQSIAFKRTVARELEKTLAMTELLKAGLKCGRVHIVVPYRDEGTDSDCITLSELEDRLSQ